MVRWWAVYWYYTFYIAVFHVDLFRQVDVISFSREKLPNKYMVISLKAGRKDP